MEIQVEVRQAQQTERADVLAVLDEAAAWLQGIGMKEQWPASFSDDPAFVLFATDLINRGQIFVATQRGHIAGCFRLDSDQHPFWPHQGDAMFLSSLAVKREFAGRGVALAMLDGASEFARSNGRSELRLDCWAGNQRLRRYYLDAGFEWRGDMEISISNNPAVPAQNRGRPFEVSLFRQAPHLTALPCLSRASGARTRTSGRRTCGGVPQKRRLPGDHPHLPAFGPPTSPAPHAPVAEH